MKKIIKLVYQNKGKSNTIYDFLIKLGFGEKNIYYLIFNKKILINDKTITTNREIVKHNDIVNIELLEENNDLLISDKEFEIVYEDDYILVANKEKNLDVEPTHLNYKDSLANRVSSYFLKNEIPSKIHLVNRLDKLTSGLVIIAKNQTIHQLFKNVKIKKYYQAIVEGKANLFGYIKIKIAKEENSVKRVISEKGKIAKTLYKRCKYFDDSSLVKIKLLTGRTHQIRLSFAFINHPLVGDYLYGKKDGEFRLNAYKISFIHPITKKKILIKK